MSESHDDNLDDFDFIDPELEQAMNSLEQEFAALDQQQESSTENSAPSDLDPASFEDEIEGLIGNKAKVAILVTRISSEQLLAAFCQLADISADCVASDLGACAILHNLNGDGPEAAAREITTVVGGLSVVLAVNRAEKIETDIYDHGEAIESFPPPIAFSSSAPYVEDLMLGITTLEDIRSSGLAIVASGDLTREQALSIIAQHTRYGRGGASSIE